MFGIKYAKEISNNKINIKDIVKKSSLRESYSREVYKGTKLAKYVNLKEEMLF